MHNQEDRTPLSCDPQLQIFSAVLQALSQPLQPPQGHALLLLPCAVMNPPSETNGHATGGYLNVWGKSSPRLVPAAPWLANKSFGNQKSSAGCAVGWGTPCVLCAGGGVWEVAGARGREAITPTP